MAKAKKKQLSEFAQQKRIQQNKKRLNPFEVHINRDKQNVIGRKSKADKGLPGVSRAKAINKRKKTLLQEYKLQNKDNVFLDKRIGEKNSMMTEEEKIMARFAKEKIKAHKKKNIYNLNEEEILTHRGQTLEEIEKFDDPRSDDEFSDSEMKNGKLEDGFVSEAHFGGGVLSKSDGAKSRKDLIDQLIAESKKRKAEKQKIREETMDLTEKLDTEWRDLLPIISASNKTMEEQEKAAEEGKVKEQSGSSKEINKEKPDDYDMEVRKLKFEARGTPSDKLKSEDELIREEKERLEKLEADRIQRMKGFVNDNDDQIRHKSADDLDDDFVVEKINDDDQEVNAKVKKDEENDGGDDEDEDEDEEKGETDDEEEDDENEGEEEQEDEDENVKKIDKKGGTENDNEGSEDEEEENENEDEDGSSGEDNLSDLKESSSSSDEDEEEEEEDPKKTVKFADKPLSIKGTTKSRDTELKSILKSKLDVSNSNNSESNSESNVNKLNGTDSTKENESNEERQAKIREDLLKRKEIMEKARKELPYTFKVPESFEDLQKLLENKNAEYQSVIIDRMIKCNHWSLGGTNKEKLSNLFLYLLQHINNCAIGNTTKSVLNCFNVLDRLAPYLYDLAHVSPENTKTFVQEIIKEKHEEFEKNKKKYPGLDTLVFFKLVSLIFPTSDFRHAITTPCIVFMSQILLRCRIKTRADLSKGLFICALMLEYTVLSKRLAPSAINFLRGVIFYSTPKHLIQGQKMIPPFKTIGESSNMLLLESNIEIDESETQMKSEDLVLTELTDEYKVRALLTAVKMLKEFKDNYFELEAAYSIFEPIHKLIKQNKFEEYPSMIQKTIKEFTRELKELKKKKLKYLVLEKKRPKPLRMYEPKIEAVYDGKRRKPMSKEKAEKEKLLHKYKKEMKGAIREIRRDNAFLAKVQIKQQIKSDQERKRKVREIFGEAAVQQSELKKLKRKK